MAGFSVKKPLTVFVAVLGIIVLGVVAYLKMTPDLLPNMDCSVYLALATVMTRSSIGWRSTSSTCLGNSGNSSRKRTPLWAREISPGMGFVPPPTRATGDTV